MRLFHQRSPLCFDILATKPDAGQALFSEAIAITTNCLQGSTISESIYTTHRVMQLTDCLPIEKKDREKERDTDIEQDIRSSSVNA